MGFRVGTFTEFPLTWRGPIYIHTTVSLGPRVFIKHCRISEPGCLPTETPTGGDGIRLHTLDAVIYVGVLCGYSVHPIPSTFLSPSLNSAELGHAIDAQFGDPIVMSLCLLLRNHMFWHSQTRQRRRRCCSQLLTRRVCQVCVVCQWTGWCTTTRWLQPRPATEH